MKSDFEVMAERAHRAETVAIDLLAVLDQVLDDLNANDGTGISSETYDLLRKARASGRPVLVHHAATAPVVGRDWYLGCALAGSLASGHSEAQAIAAARRVAEELMMEDQRPEERR